MTSCTLIICEGPHDQAGLVSLLVSCGGWVREDHGPASVPASLGALFPQPKHDGLGRERRGRNPDFLVKDGRYVAIRALDGISQVLGDAGRMLLSQLPAQSVSGFGVIVDANGAGVGPRVASFRSAYRALFPHVDSVRAGFVETGQPHLGLWVAPNNKDPGDFADLILAAASVARAPLVEGATSFVDARIAPASGRVKAILGAVGQADEPAGALATALRKGRWFEPDLANRPPFGELLAFVDALAGFRDPTPSTS